MAYRVAAVMWSGNEWGGWLGFGYCPIASASAGCLCRDFFVEASCFSCDAALFDLCFYTPDIASFTLPAHVGDRLLQRLACASRQRSHKH